MGAERNKSLTPHFVLWVDWFTHDIQDAAWIYAYTTRESARGYIMPRFAVSLVVDRDC